MKLGLQMYSLGGAPREDLEGTLKKIKEIGYDGIELCGFAGHKHSEFKKMLDDNGLEAPSCHSGLPDNGPYDSIFETYAEVGVKYIIIPHLAYDAWFPKCNFDETFRKIKAYGDCARKHGMQIGFHNHFLEFTEVFGKTVMDHIFENTADDFLMEIDCCWAEFGTCDAAYKIVEKYAPKTSKVCHFKQLFDRNFPNPDTMNGGCVNLKAVAEYYKKNAPDCWAIVEQEGMEDVSPMEAAKINHDFMRTIL